MFFDFQFCWTHTHTSWTVGVDEKEGAYWNLIWFIINLSVDVNFFLLCLMWFRHCKSQKRGKTKNILVSKRQEGVCCCCTCVPKTFKNTKTKYKFIVCKIQYYLQQQLPLQNYNNSTVWRDFFLFFFVLLENDSRGGSKTKCLFSRALKHKYLFISIINLFFM